MLELVLLTGNEGRRLEPALARLQAALAQGVDLTIVDRGSQDGTLARLDAFVQGSGQGARLLRLEAPELDLAGALEAAAAGQAGRYRLGLTGQDLICPEALTPLMHRLQREKPDLAVCAQGWWLTGGVPLAPADADGLAAQAAAQVPDVTILQPDPRRLIPSAALAAEHGPLRPGPGPIGSWTTYDIWTGAAERILVYPEPVALRPLPEISLQSLFFALLEQVSTQPKGAGRVAALERGLGRIGAEIRFADPAQAPADIAAATDLLRGLNRSERQRAAAVPGPAGALLSALRDGGRRHGPGLALAVLARQTAAEDRRRLNALAMEIRGLRADLDLALPGPEYLRRLYERLRST